MAFSGIHLVCFWASASGDYSASLAGPLIWSETLTADGAFSKRAPDGRGKIRVAIRVTTSVDRYFAHGDAPDAVNGPRQLVLANTPYDFYVDPNSKFACVSA